MADLGNPQQRRDDRQGLVEPADRPVDHRLQLAAYSLLAEGTFHRPAADGFIYLVPEKRIVPLGLTEADRDDVRQALADIRRMIEREALPDPTPVRARCSACEFQNYCGDIW